jgi:hypothetical protein
MRALPPEEPSAGRLLKPGVETLPVARPIDAAEWNNSNPVGVIHDPDRGTVVLKYEILGQDRASGAKSARSPAGEDQQSVGELRRERKVVNCRKHSQSLFGPEGIDELQDLLLMAYVQSAGWLVQQQDRSPLCQSARQDGPLQLSP